jgi:hypothetical protein
MKHARDIRDAAVPGLAINNTSRANVEKHNSTYAIRAKDLIVLDDDDDTMNLYTEAVSRKWLLPAVLKACYGRGLVLRHPGGIPTLTTRAPFNVSAKATPI